MKEYRVLLMNINNFCKVKNCFEYIKLYWKRYWLLLVLNYFCILVYVYVYLELF